MEHADRLKEIKEIISEVESEVMTEMGYENTFLEEILLREVMMGYRNEDQRAFLDEMFRRLDARIPDLNLYKREIVYDWLKEKIKAEIRAGRIIEISPGVFQSVK